jgi:hypothetical protein
MLNEEQLSDLTKHINGGHNYARICYDSMFDRLEIYGTLSPAHQDDDFVLDPPLRIERISNYDMIGNYDFVIVDMNDIARAYEGSKQKMLDKWTDPLIAKKWIDLIKRHHNNLPTYNFWEHI